MDIRDFCSVSAYWYSCITDWRYLVRLCCEARAIFSLAFSLTSLFLFSKTIIFLILLRVVFTLTFFFGDFAFSCLAASLFTLVDSSEVGAVSVIDD